MIETATPTKRKFRVVQSNEYEVYRDEDGNAQSMDGRIINVSKEDIKEILEMAYKSGGNYLSLPQYEGCLQMPELHLTTHSQPVDDVKELIRGVFKAQEKMPDELYQKIDGIYYPLTNSVAWLSKCMDDLQLKVDYTHEIIQRQQEHKTRGEKKQSRALLVLGSR